jgi:hypothetical protein
VVAALWEFAAEVRAQPHPVIDTWGVNISATTTGLGYITFLGNGTLAGCFIVKPTLNVKPANLPPIVKYGFTFIKGAWALDSSDNVIGFFSGGSETAPIDMSFSATVKVTKKTTSISIRATGNNGPMQIKGNPVTLTVVPGLDGPTSWTAEVLKNDRKFVEFFQLSPYVRCLDDTENDPDPGPDLDPDTCQAPEAEPVKNLYALEGVGAGYVTRGEVLVGLGGKIGLVVEELRIDKDTGIAAEPGEGIFRSVFGELKLGKIPMLGKASMNGVDEESVAGVNTKINMVATSSDLLP